MRMSLTFPLSGTQNHPCIFALLIPSKPGRVTHDEGVQMLESYVGDVTCDEFIQTPPTLWRGSTQKPNMLSIRIRYSPYLTGAYFHLSLESLLEDHSQMFLSTPWKLKWFRFLPFASRFCIRFSSAA